MRGLLALAGMLAATALAFLAPPWVLAALALAFLALMRRGRAGFLLFGALTLLVNVALLAWLVPGPGVPGFSQEGALLGWEGGLRLVAAMGGNLAILSWVAPARILEDLRLPARATALLAALLIASHDVGRDFDRLRLARRLRGDWPKGRLARAREAARILPALLVAGERRARVRRDALRLAGQDVGPWFVKVVAIAALAAAGRLAFLAFPNVALTYAVVFLGGLVYGAGAGMAGGALAMLLTDFMLTGLFPPGFVNVPAMALLALLGAGMRRFDFVGGSRVERATGLALAASLGVACTLLFSVAADSLTWLLLYADAPAAWAPLVLAGLAFNVVPAFVNGVLFAASIPPTVKAYRAMGRLGPVSPRAEGRAPSVPPRGPEDADPAHEA
jgi:hypothetical protein